MKNVTGSFRTASMGIKSKIAMNTLKGQEMLMLDDGHCLRNQALDYCFMAGAKEDPHFQATSLETLRNMVAANAGITFMPELAVLNEGTRAGVKYIPCHSPEPSLYYCSRLPPRFTIT